MLAARIWQRALQFLVNGARTEALCMADHNLERVFPSGKNVGCLSEKRRSGKRNKPIIKKLSD
jgi:hypothetical protein